MREDSKEELSPMRGCQNSPEILKSLKSGVSRRKLFFSENLESTPDSCDSCESKPKKLNAVSLTPRRTTPLSERQQIALLCKLSASDTTSTDSSPVLFEENCGLSTLQKRNERGETPLHIATIKGDLQKVRQLLNLGARVNTADFAGWTPLHEACNHGWHGIAKLLIQFGADVNAPGLDKITPLHDAAVNKHEQIVSLLLKYGANPLQENVHKRTPFDVARSTEVSDLLKAAIELKRQKELKAEGCPPYQEHLRTPEAVGSRQSETSTCHPISALCEPTMRKNSPQSQTHKGAEKPTSPRLTLRFQSIRSRDDKSTSSATKINDISNSQPRYPSYCVTMEAKGDVYDFRKDDAIVSSTCPTSTCESEGTGSVCDAVSSSTSNKPEDCEDKATETPEMSTKTSPIEKMDTSESNSKVNGGRVNADSNNKEKDCSSDVEKEENRRKRRKSNDSVQSRHSAARGHKSPSSKNQQQDGHGDQKSPKTRKRGSLSSSDTESNPSDAEPVLTEGTAESGGNTSGSSTNHNLHSPKVPPLKIVLPSGTGGLESSETRERNKVSSSKQALPYVVNTTTSETMDAESVGGPVMSDADKEGLKSENGKSKDESSHPPSAFQRVTRSSQRMQAAMSGSSLSQCQSSEHSNIVSSSSQKGDASGESSNDEQMHIQVDVHPRKRKIRTKENPNETGSQNPSCASSSSSEDSQQQHQSLNSYQMFLNIRKQVDKRRKSMFVVHPKPPQGFKDYLLNRCSYVLEGNAASLLSVPMISPPPSLEGAIKDLFILQEKERYRLRLQHLIEREKLVLSVEQEILRVHGRAARAMANQTIPLSVCSILKDEEIYNVLEDDKDKNVRSRYNGRLFLSWRQDVDDKWEKIKGAMLLRHHNEAESLHAVQQLDWTWKMKELDMCDRKTAPVIDDIFVPMVHVSDDFDLPA